MLNKQHFDMLHFWLSEEGQQLRAFIDLHSLGLGSDIASYLLSGITKLLPYFQYERVLSSLQQVRAAQALNVLDLGCGNGWEAFGLAFLLHPAKVVGISNDADEPQAWDTRSITNGAFLETFPQLLEGIENVLPWVDEISACDRLRELHSAMKTIRCCFLDFMRHDIQETLCPADNLPFGFVFSKYSFYHASDRIQALQAIRDCMAQPSAYLLYEPSITIEGNPDLTPDWFSEVAVQQLGFADCHILNTDNVAVTVLLER